MRYFWSAAASFQAAVATAWVFFDEPAKGSVIAMTAIVFALVFCGDRK